MLHYFNPGHETAVMNTLPYYMAPGNVSQMQKDLSFLPAWYGSENDCVLVNKDTALTEFDFFSKNFPTLPLPLSSEKIALTMHFEVSLWGISPQAIHFFNKLNEQCQARLQIPVWHDEYIELNSRKSAKNCLLEIVRLHPEFPSEIVPKFYQSVKNIETDRAKSSQNLLVKAPFSSSGRGLLWLSSQERLEKKEIEIINGMLKRQGCVSIEPVWDKQVDFSMQFMCDGKGNVSFEGYSLFETNNKGSYMGSYLLPQEKIISIVVDKISPSLLKKAQQSICSFLSKKYAPVYKGCIGIDMMIYRKNGMFQLHPCLEINMRYNMGYLAMKLYDKYIQHPAEGKYIVDFNAEEGEIFRKHAEMQQKFPVYIRDGKIQQGYLSLCPVTPKSKYRAYIII